MPEGLSPCRDRKRDSPSTGTAAEEQEKQEKNGKLRGGEAKGRERCG